MAQRRMFSPQIVDSDAFLDMPPTSQLLYFHLAMRADDDGFVGNPRKILRMVGGNDDDLRILIGKRFLLTFESGVVVIKHWRIHNLIRADRYHETKYLDEKEKLIIKDNGAYTELPPSCIPLGNHMETEVRLDEVRLDKDNKDAPETDADNKDSFDPIDMDLASLLRDRIVANIPTFKEPKMSQWANHVRLMRERDKRTPEQIRYLINWCQTDPFWQANILSTKKLREKFDTLVAQVKRKVNAETLKKSNVAFV